MYAFCSAVWSTLVVYMCIMVGTETRRFVCYARGFRVIQERSSIYNVKVTRSHSTMLHQMFSDVHLEFVNHS